MADFDIAGANLPYSLDAEQSVLGAILLDSAANMPKATAKLTAEHFYVQLHSDIFAVMSQMFARSETIDIVTVLENCLNRADSGKDGYKKKSVFESPEEGRTYLVKLMEGHKVNMQKLTGRSYERKYFIDYRADREDPLAMLYQSGYLTIKGYDRRRMVYKLDYPNDEVRKGFVSLIGNSYFRKPPEDNDNWILELDDMLRECDLDGVRKAFRSFLSSIPYEANKDERAKDFETHFSYTFYIINRLLGCYTTLIEKQNSKGRADIIIETDNDIFIFKFKLDGSAEEALKQIEEQQYAVPYLDDVTPEERESIDKMVERLEEFDDVQNVYTNMK